MIDYEKAWNDLKEEITCRRIEVFFNEDLGQAVMVYGEVLYLMQVKEMGYD